MAIHVEGPSLLNLQFKSEFTDNDGEIGIANSVTQQSTQKLFKVSFDEHGMITGYTEIPIDTSIPTTPVDTHLLSTKAVDTIVGDISALIDAL